jgi:hypothetical protein
MQGALAHGELEVLVGVDARQLDPDHQLPVVDELLEVELAGQERPEGLKAAEELRPIEQPTTERMTLGQRLRSATNQHHGCLLRARQSSTLKARASASPAVGPLVPPARPPMTLALAVRTVSMTRR